MKDFIRLFLRALPFVLGLISTLTALSFLISFSESPSISRIFDEGEFFLFVAFAMIGLPLTLFGINRLAIVGTP